MIHFIIRLIVNAIALIIVAYLFQGHGVIVTSFTGAIIAAFVLGIVNAILRPILIILTLPIQIVTLGLFTFVINALLVEFTALIIPGFYVANFWWALLFSLVMSVLGWL